MISDDGEFAELMQFVPNTWRPMETAPKDGTHILGCDGKAIRVIRWQYSITDDCAGWLIPGGTGQYPGPGAYLSPTHWMPLPARPKSGEMA